MTEAQRLKEADAAASAYVHFRKSFPAFNRFITPNRIPAAHQDKLAKILQEVEADANGRLIISFPPQHGKTQVAGVHFTTWHYGNHPDSGIIYTSFNQERAEWVGALARDLTKEPRFRATFPHLKLDPNLQGKGVWRFAGHDGFFKAVGREGPTTGFKANLLVIDDPYKDAEEADSALLREKLWDWYRRVLHSRLHPNAKVIVIHTRWHEGDLIGRLIEHNGKGETWRVFNFPAIDDDGNTLWPEYFPLEHYLNEMEVQGGESSRGWTALYQGRPVPMKGLLFKEDWFNKSDDVPNLSFWIRYWDTALTTKKQSDYTVGAKVGVDENGTIWVADIVRFREEWPEARRRILETVASDGAGVMVGIERSSVSLTAVQDLRNNDLFLTIPLHETVPDKDKYQRAAPWAARAQAGKLCLQKGAWNESFIHECCAFPHGKHDDQVDAVSGAVALLAKMRGTTIYEQALPKPGTVAYFDKLYDAYGFESDEDDAEDAGILPNFVG